MPSSRTEHLPPKSHARYTVGTSIICIACAAPPRGAGRGSAQAQESRSVRSPPRQAACVRPTIGCMTMMHDLCKQRGDLQMAVRQVPRDLRTVAIEASTKHTPPQT